MTSSRTGFHGSVRDLNGLHDFAVILWFFCERGDFQLKPLFEEECFLCTQMLKWSSSDQDLVRSRSRTVLWIFS